MPSEDSKKSIKDILDDIYGPYSSAYYENTIEGRKIAKMFRREEHDENDFIQNILSLPQKAFIKCEYVSCGKPNCDQDHGPYYYGYWKDKVTKKLRKKYLGKLR
jgi:hypothetical protein